MKVAKLFDAVFKAGVDGHAIDMTTPAGPSTAGGKLALQHIRVAPRGGGRAIVVGSYDTAKRVAELRTYKLLADTHAERFAGEALPIRDDEYKALIKRMLEFFTKQGITVVMVSASRDPSLAGAEPTSKAALLARVTRSKAAVVGVAVVVVLALVAWLSLR